MAKAHERDPLQIQISAKFTVKKGKQVTGDLMRQAIRWRLDKGEDPPGIELRIVQWRNPGRKRADLRQWRTGDQESAWNTLKNAIRGWLDETNSTTVAFEAVRRREGNG